MEILHETLAKEIRDLRLSMHMDQQNLADAIDVSRSSISNIESGRQLVTLTLFYKIAHALNKVPGVWLDSLLDKSLSTQPLSKHDVDNEDVFKTISDLMGGK